MFRLASLVVAALALAAGPPALAQASKTHADWAFVGDGVAGLPPGACVAATRAGRVSLFLAAAPAPDGTVALYTLLRDPRWNHAGEPVDYRLEFDGFSWTISGRGQGDDFLVQWRTLATYLEFMEDIASHEEATLYAGDDGLLANFSLEGSRSATIDLELCVEAGGGTFGRMGPAVGNIESVKRTQ